jgi:hypothetical protein
MIAVTLFFSARLVTAKIWILLIFFLSAYIIFLELKLFTLGGSVFGLISLGTLTIG